jgi:hypothetical protein
MFVAAGGDNIHRNQLFLFAIITDGLHTSQAATFL